jgi:hypothetical protein
LKVAGLLPGFWSTRNGSLPPGTVPNSLRPQRAEDRNELRPGIRADYIQAPLEHSYRACWAVFPADFKELLGVSAGSVTCVPQETHP